MFIMSHRAFNNSQMSWNIYSYGSYRFYSKRSSFLHQFYLNLTEDLLYIRDENHHCNGRKYQNAVFDLLRKYKVDNGISVDSDRLIKLQKDIEALAYPYDDIQSMYEATPMLINLLIKKDAPSAKEYLKSSNKLTPDELVFLNQFHQYTLEGIIVYIFGYIFNSLNDSPAVRVSTLVDQLDSMARIQARLLYERNKEWVGRNEPGVVEPDSKKKTIGVLLVEYLLDRELITITNDLSIPGIRVETKKKDGKYYKKKSSYVICNFDINILPVQLNLPMVCPPKSWDVVHRLKERGEAPKSLSDITGGYLSEPVGDLYLYNRYRLLASRDKDNFNILLDKKYQDMCDTMNALQGEAFEINVGMLDYLNNNYALLVEKGLLLPRGLALINIAAATKKLREEYLKYEDKLGIKYPSLLKEFLSDIQRARYESFVLEMASAYAGYEFYLPAYVDFRGRIYRAGVLHFHERDLARSLIVFSKRTVNKAKNDNPSQSDEYNTRVTRMLMAATAFHYKKFPTYAAACDWVSRNELYSLPGTIDLAADASDPFQFISKVITIAEIDSRVTVYQLPITQDASASAYQIISYFLLDFHLANNTNLIPTKVKKKNEGEVIQIKDVYEFFVSEILAYFKNECKNLKDPNLIINYVCPRLHRKLVKSLLMPLVYGKTAYSMADDLYLELNDLLGQKECLELATLIEKFFKKRFPHIVNLMSIIRSVGWIASAMESPVFYSTPVFTTVQDYMKSEAVKIWIYDRPSKKRRQVTLRVPTKERDRKKTTAAIFANFVHQKDANIAFYMIKNLKESGIPIYTVHDNFITTPDFAPLMAGFYIDIFVKGPHPLEYINAFIQQNILGLKHYIGDDPELYKDEAIPVEILRYHLYNLNPPELYKKKKRKIWDNRLNDFINAYYHYIVSIRYTGSEPKPISVIDSYDSDYFTRLDKFRKECSKWVDNHQIYCLHL